jgi:hypothetical protein
MFFGDPAMKGDTGQFRIMPNCVFPPATGFWMPFSRTSCTRPGASVISQCRSTSQTRRVPAFSMRL